MSREVIEIGGGGGGGWEVGMSGCSIWYAYGYNVCM